eukprot:scaffold1198_cov116-Isochrysis_galbana.AAC.2
MAQGHAGQLARAGTVTAAAAAASSSTSWRRCRCCWPRRVGSARVHLAWAHAARCQVPGSLRVPSLPRYRGQRRGCDARGWPDLEKGANRPDYRETGSFRAFVAHKSHLPFGSHMNSLVFLNMIQATRLLGYHEVKSEPYMYVHMCDMCSDM